MAVQSKYTATTFVNCGTLLRSLLTVFFLFSAEFTGNSVCGQTRPFRPTGQFAAGTSVGDFFGYQIVVLDDAVAVAVRDDDTLAENAGAVHIYDHDGHFVRSIGSPNPEVDGKFGFYMTAVGSDRQLISANRENGESGRAYLFHKDGTLAKSFEAVNEDFDHEFGGRFLPANETRLFIPAWNEQFLDGADRVYSGAVYTYDHDGNPISVILNPNLDEDGLNCLGNSGALRGYRPNRHW